MGSMNIYRSAFMSAAVLATGDLAVVHRDNGFYRVKLTGEIVIATISMMFSGFIFINISSHDI